MNINQRKVDTEAMMLIKEIQIVKGELCARIDVFYLQISGLQALIDHCLKGTNNVKSTKEDEGYRRCILKRSAQALLKQSKPLSELTGRVSFFLMKGSQKLQ